MFLLHLMTEIRHCTEVTHGRKTATPGHERRANSEWPIANNSKRLLLASGYSLFSDRLSMTMLRWWTWGAIVAAAALGLVASGFCDWGLAKEWQSRSSASKLKKKEKAVRGKTSVLSVQRIVEAPERFSRRVDWNRDGQIDPLEKAVALDHFRQLDRNRDGVVDPMERAVARLDIEYDGPVVPRDAEWVQAQIQRAASRDGHAREQGGPHKVTKRPKHPKPVTRKGGRSTTSPLTR